MRKLKSIAVCALCLCLLLSLAGCAAAQRPLRVTLVLKTETDVAEFWGMLLSGVRKAAEEYGVDLTVRTSPTENIRTDDDPLQDFRADHVLQISATENAGLDAVKDVLQEMLREDKIYIERVIPYAQAGVLQLVRNKGELVSEEYVPEGISIRAYVPMEVYGKL